MRVNQAKSCASPTATSSIGVEKDQKDTVRRLGLSRLGATVEQPDTPGDSWHDPQGPPSGDGGRDRSSKQRRP